MMQTAQPVLVGTSLPRQDGPDKVTGRARYAGDYDATADDA
jgi:CO/xanthine dehydrogenase Mo-binding subunit